MRIPPPVLLFLALVLIPDPGGSQFGPQFARCKDCKEPDNPEKFKEEKKKEVQKYDVCPHGKTVRFQLKNGMLCADKDQTWAKEVIACFLRDKKTCQDDASSSSRKEFSKGTNEKPSTTTNTPTTVPVTSVKPSTQSQDQNIGWSTEPTAPNDLNTTPLDSNKENGNLAHGKDHSIEPQNPEDQHSKIKHMQTIIISLIMIILVVVAVGVGVCCRMKKANKSSTLCGSIPFKYMTAPSQDPLREVNVDG